jgi:hypothetical protein
MLLRKGIGSYKNYNRQMKTFSGRIGRVGSGWITNVCSMGRVYGRSRRLMVYSGIAIWKNVSSCINAGSAVFATIVTNETAEGYGC